MRYHDKHAVSGVECQIELQHLTIWNKETVLIDSTTLETNLGRSPASSKTTAFVKNNADPKIHHRITTSMVAKSLQVLNRFRLLVMPLL